MKNETTVSGSVPADVNVKWQSGFRDRLKKCAVNIYDDGSTVELPDGGDLSKVFDSFYSLKADILEFKGSHPFHTRPANELLGLIEECIDEAIIDPGFDFTIAYPTIYRMFSGIKTEALSSNGKGIKKAFSAIANLHICPYCYTPVPKYPGVEDSRCPVCRNQLKTIYDSKREPLDEGIVKEAMDSIRGMFSPRLVECLKKMREGSFPRLDALKVSLSCMAHVVSEEQKRPSKGILDNIGEPLLVDILSMFVGEDDQKTVQTRVGKFFIAEEILFFCASSEPFLSGGSSTRPSPTNSGPLRVCLNSTILTESSSISNPRLSFLEPRK